ncbi:hypothetical protein J4D99_07165 [Siccationidurans ginsengisoli]|uniref:hypothetical protein n=1 Tax=Hymenobacter ginsengisoli TaxID=1051626 RepID=UPI001AD02242|nr:hypothetical protein [Hymenobacter sp. BT559]
MVGLASSEQVAVFFLKVWQFLIGEPAHNEHIKVGAAETCEAVAPAIEAKTIMVRPLITNRPQVFSAALRGLAICLTNSLIAAFYAHAVL